MKSFIKNVFANIVAIVLLGLIFVCFLVFIAVAGSGSGADVKENSVLTLDLNTQIVDSPTEFDSDLLAFDSETQYALTYDIVKAIQKAKTDDNIKGISIEADDMEAGITQIDNIRKALEDFKTSKKFVYAYSNTTSQSSYYLSSVADAYYLNPMGTIDLKGLSMNVTFLKDFAEKYGISIDVLRYGKYKSAVEPYLRNDMSEENKEQLSTLLNSVWSNISKKIATSRKIDEQNLKVAVDSLYGFIPQLSLKHKLVDKLAQKTEYDNFIKKQLNIKKDKKLNKINFADYISTMEEKSSSDKVAVLYASGTIQQGDGLTDIQSERYVKLIKKLQNDDKVKAVVLRVNSPGGDANAADAILFELQNLKTKKPLVVSFGDYAASGGYYIAMAGDKIYSEPNTLTGSIGVFATLPNAKELANRNGIYQQSVSTNANSEMYSPLSGLSEGGRHILTQSVENTYKRFVGFVMANRKKTFEQVDNVGSGRVWSGTKAKEIGLVDELGTLDDAIKFVATKAKLKDFSIESYPREATKFEQLFGKSGDEDLSTKIIKQKIGKDQFRIYEMLTNTQSKMIMENPYRISFK